MGPAWCYVGPRGCYMGPEGHYMGPLWRYGDLGVLDGSARCNMALGGALDDVTWALQGVTQTLGVPTGIPWHYMVLVSTIWALGGVLGLRTLPHWACRAL